MCILYHIDQAAGGPPGSLTDLTIANSDHDRYVINDIRNINGNYTNATQKDTGAAVTDSPYSGAHSNDISTGHASALLHAVVTLDCISTTDSTEISDTNGKDSVYGPAILRSEGYRTAYCELLGHVLERSKVHT